MNPLPKVVPVKSADDINLVRQASIADKDELSRPTVMVIKDNKLIGGASINPPGIPTVIVWMDSQKASPKDSLLTINQLEAIVAVAGAHGVMVPVNKQSPFFSVMEHLGYKNAGEFNIFTKEF